ncbi:MAG: excisionase family DNA-binding protein [Polyangiaceae bacterium]|nr:excisionase family DNA-binding protein [Polyangiaceae bacterium]
MQLGWFKPLHELIPEFGVRDTNGPAVCESTTAVQTPDKEKASVPAGFGRIDHEGRDATITADLPHLSSPPRPLGDPEREAFRPAAGIPPPVVGHEGLEPSASGSKVGDPRSSAGSTPSQPLVAVQIPAGPAVPTSPRFAAIRTPLVTPLLQAAATGAAASGRDPRLETWLLTVKEAAKALRVSTATVYAMVGRGELEHVRVSNAIRIVVFAPEASGGQRCSRLSLWHRVKEEGCTSPRSDRTRRSCGRDARPPLLAVLLRIALERDDFAPVLSRPEAPRPRSLDARFPYPGCADPARSRLAIAGRTRSEFVARTLTPEPRHAH